MTDPISVIPDHIADLARAALWIESVALDVESCLTPDDSWIRVSSANSTFSGEWVFGDLVAAVKSAVKSAGRDWTEWDRRLFPALPCDGCPTDLV